VLDRIREPAGQRSVPGNPSHEPRLDEARRSIVRLGDLAFETRLVGHGDPIEAGASALVADLGASG